MRIPVVGARAPKHPYSSADGPWSSVPPLWDMYRDGVTQGLLSSFMTCPEMVRLGSREGWSGTGSTVALDFGTLVHEALDRFYTASGKLRSSEVPYSDWSPMLLESVLDGLQRQGLDQLAKVGRLSEQNHTALLENHGMARVVLSEYLEQWETDLHELDWVALEQKFCVPFDPAEVGFSNLPPINLRGKRDGVFRASQALGLFETKTKGRVEEDAILDSLPYNLQVGIYLHSMEVDYGEPCQNLIYNIIRRPGMKRKVREGLDVFLERVRDDIRGRRTHYFIRYNATFTKEERERWHHDFLGVMRSLISWYHGHFHYRNSSACSNHGGCKFLPICGRSDYLYFQRREHVFPELEDGDGG